MQKETYANFISFCSLGKDFLSHKNPENTNCFVFPRSQDGEMGCCNLNSGSPMLRWIHVGRKETLIR